MKLLTYIVVLLCLILGVSFAVLNASDATVHLYWREVTLPLSLILALTFATGAFFGILFCLVAIIKAKSEASHYKRKSQQIEKELDNFRKLE